jgi:hypothetical protein
VVAVSLPLGGAVSLFPFLSYFSYHQASRAFGIVFVEISASGSNSVAFVCFPK